MALIYTDSARQNLEALLKFFPDEPHMNSYLGLTLAYLGECDRAIEYGARGKELYSVETCHW